jgi:hypothetical protein
MQSLKTIPADCAEQSKVERVNESLIQGKDDEVIMAGMAAGEGRVGGVVGGGRSSLPFLHASF